MLQLTSLHKKFLLILDGEKILTFDKNDESFYSDNEKRAEWFIDMLPRPLNWYTKSSFLIQLLATRQSCFVTENTLKNFNFSLVEA